MDSILYKFKKNGHEEFIDFMKGVAILLVVFAHTIPLKQELLFPIWGASKAVPIFLVIQMFHTFKRGEPKVPNFKKVFDRVLKPFLYIQIILLTFSLITSSETTLETLCRFCKGGGMGPGSYYIWIYLQFSLILPYIYKLLSKYNQKRIFFISLFTAILIEMACSIIDMPERIYRILALRYLFLIYFGIEWCRKGIVFGKREIFLGLIGLGAVVYFNYFYVPIEPFFFNTGWKSDRWITFIYVMYIFVPILYKIYNKVGCKIKGVFYVLGKASFEIFLIQMLVCCIIKPNVVGEFIDNNILKWIVYLTITISSSIGIGLLYYKRKHQN